MGDYAGVLFDHLLVVIPLFLTWIVAAWLASHAARRKTSRALRVMSVLGLPCEVAMKADNPGVWMNHCHNLRHAATGMVLHLMYDNVSTTYVAGTATRNHPE